jgi:hypothetical protein
MKSPPAKKDLRTYEGFKESAADWLDPIVREYQKRAILADRAYPVLAYDIEVVNKEYFAELGRVLLTSVKGRVKDVDSFLRKVYR